MLVIMICFLHLGLLRPCLAKMYLDFDCDLFSSPGLVVTSAMQLVVSTRVVTAGVAHHHLSHILMRGVIMVYLYIDTDDDDNMMAIYIDHNHLSHILMTGVIFSLYCD